MRKLDLSNISPKAQFAIAAIATLTFGCMTAYIINADYRQYDTGKSIAAGMAMTAFSAVYAYKAAQRLLRKTPS